MARRAAPPPRPERPSLTAEQKRRGIARLQKRIEELEAFDPRTVQKRFSRHYSSARSDALQRQAFSRDGCAGVRTRCHLGSDMRLARYGGAGG